MGNDGGTKLAALDFGGPFHEPSKIIGHPLGGDGSIHPLDDEVGCLGPTHIPKHHLARQDNRTGVDPIEVGVFGRGAGIGGE